MSVSVGILTLIIETLKNNWLLFFSLILLLAAIMGEFFHRIKVPRIVGYILLGIILSILISTNSIIGEIWNVHKNSFEFISNLGVIFLLFLVGMEVDLKELLSSSKDAIAAMSFSVILTFVSGFLVGIFLGFDWIVSIGLGAALAVTAKGAKSAILMEFNAIKTKLGNIMFTASIADDIFEVIFLTVTTAFKDLNLKSISGLTIIEKLKLMNYCVVLLLFSVLYVVLPKILEKLKISSHAIFMICIMICLLIAGIFQTFNISAALGAFFGGIIVNNLLRDDGKYDEYLKIIEYLSLYFLTPFFFISVGAKFELQSITNDPFVFTLIFIVSSLGPVLGGILYAIITKRFSLEQGFLFGVSMWSRGEMGVIIASQVLLPYPSLYSSVILSILIGDIVFPILFGYMLRKYPHILE